MVWPDYVEKNYMTINPFSRPGNLRINTFGFVIHWVGVADQEPDETIRFWESLKNQNPRDKIKDWFGSAQAIVHWDGSVHVSMPIDEVANHAGASSYNKVGKALLPEWTTNKKVKDIWHTPNLVTLGIELSHTNMTGRPSKAQKQALVRLCVDLGIQVHNPFYARHTDFNPKKTCPRYYVKQPLLWQNLVSEIHEIRNSKIGQFVK